MDTFSALRSFCLSLPHTIEKQPWGRGESAFQVGGRSYAFVTEHEGHTSVSAKPEPNLLEAWLAVPGAMPAPYVGRFGWVSLRAEDGDPASLDRAQALIWQSHALRTRLAVRAARPKAKDAPDRPATRRESSARIRRAGPADLPDLAALREAHWLEDQSAVGPSTSLPPIPESTRGPSFVERMRSTLEVDLRTGATFAWIAYTDQEAVGCLFLQPVRKIPWPNLAEAHFGYVTGVYVRPAFRRQHLGQALLRAVQAHAKRHRFEFLVLWPSAESHAFYRAVQFTPGEGEEHPWLWTPRPGDR